MLLNVRSISLSAAVVCFFAVSLIGVISSISPFTCCKRALIAAIVIYVITTLAVKAVNAILLYAIINNQVNQQKEETSGNSE